MDFIRTTNLNEYAAYFWRRQVVKQDQGDIEALTDLRRGGDPLNWMRIRHPYKLPDESSVIQVWRLSQADVESLSIPNHIVNDDKMSEYNLILDPPTAAIDKIALAAVERGFFENPTRTAMYKRYVEWCCSRTLQNAIVGDEMTLIREVEPGKHVIVDGWGRYLAFVSLLKIGFEFYPVESFVSR